MHSETGKPVITHTRTHTHTRKHARKHARTYTRARTHAQTHRSPCLARVIFPCFPLFFPFFLFFFQVKCFPVLTGKRLVQSHPVVGWGWAGLTNRIKTIPSRRGDQAAMLSMAVKDAGATQVASVVVTSAKSHRQNYQIARRVARNDRYRLAVVRAVRHRDRATRVWS